MLAFRHKLLCKEDTKMKKTAKTLSIFFVFILLLTQISTVFADGGSQRGHDLIVATGDDMYIQFPDEESYLPEFKSRFVYHPLVGPCAPVEKFPKRYSGGPMPYAYDGTEVTVVAEQGEMSCIIYRDSTNRTRAGWIWNTDLTDEFPGKEYTVGEYRDGSSLIEDVPMHWSERSFLTTQQNYSVLEEPVENCIGFILEYQLIKENTKKWERVLGPRTIYVNNGEEWIEVGSFEYPEFGPVRIEVNLEEPMNIAAVGTIADCSHPNLFYFRQYAFDYRIA